MCKTKKILGYALIRYPDSPKFDWGRIQINSSCNCEIMRKYYPHYWIHDILSAILDSTWWRHQMETFSPLLALYAGNSLVTGEFPSQRPVTRNFDVFFDLRLEKNGCVNNREAGALRRHRAYYDVIVMIIPMGWCKKDVTKLRYQRSYVFLALTQSIWSAHWGPCKMDAMSQTTVWNACSLMKKFSFLLEFIWNLFPLVHLIISHYGSNNHMVPNK